MGKRKPDPPAETPAPRKKKAAPREATCKVISRLGGKEPRHGLAVLGPAELRFHTGKTGRHGNDFALQIAYEDIESMECDPRAGTLVVQTEEYGRVVFQLGRLAAEWMAIIEARPGPLDVLGVTRTSRVAVIAVDDEEFLAQLAEAIPGETRSGPLDLLFAGASHPADLARLGELAGRLRPGGALWVVYARASRTMTPARIAEAAQRAGLVAGDAVELSRVNDALGLVKP